jgi:hypothetical protein
MKLNPSTISWQNPTQYTDGTTFGPTDLVGYEFGYKHLDDTGYTSVVVLPIAWEQTSLNLTQLELPRNVPLQLSMATVAKNGLKSEWAAPADLMFDTRIPNPPLALRAD